MKKINNKEQNQDVNNSSLKRRVVPGIILIGIGIFLLLVPYSVFALVAFLILIAFSLLGGHELLKNYKDDTWGQRFLRGIMATYFFTAIILFGFLALTESSYDFLRLGGEDGRYWFVSTLLIVGIGSDLTAYFVGTFCKKKWKTHKIAPRISPNKSVEGTAATFIVSPILSWLLGTQLLGLNDSLAVMLGFLLAFLAYAGDIFESFYKRVMEVKDSGSLFQGHGGALDVIDSHLMAIYGIYGFQYLVFSLNLVNV